MNRYYDIDPSTGGTARKSRGRYENAASSSRRQRHTAARTVRARTPRLDALESGALGADQKAAWPN